MNASNESRLRAAESRAIRLMTDEELEAIVTAPSDDGIDVTQLTDAQLRRIVEKRTPT